MKILYINVFYDPLWGGGAEITLKHLTAGLAAKNHDVSVITLHQEKTSVVETIDGVKVYRLPIKNMYLPYFEQHKITRLKKILWHLIDIYNPSSAQSVEKFVNEINPDIVSFHNIQGFSPSIWNALKKKNIPMVQVLHDQYLLCPTSMLNRKGENCSTQCLTCYLGRLPHRYQSNTLTAVVGVSHHILNKYLSLGYFHNCPVKKVIYNRRPDSFRMKATRKGIKKNRETINIGFIGSIAMNKGIEKLLEAYVSLNTEEKINLIIAGEGKEDYESRLKNTYRRDDIHFIGKVDPHEFYPNIDVLVVPSLLEEALGVVVPEALVYGIPVIGSKLGAIPEIINHGENGYLINPNNIQEIKIAIERYINNRNHFRAGKGILVESASKFFDYDGWLDEWEQLYNELIDRKKVGFQNIDY